MGASDKGGIISVAPAETRDGCSVTPSACNCRLAKCARLGNRFAIPTIADRLLLLLEI